MNLAGDEKQIRALFSELRFVDEQSAPSFTATWSRAQARTIKPRRAFNLSFVAATALLICALVSLAVWSKYSQRSATPNAPVAVTPVTSNPTPNKNGSPIPATATVDKPANLNVHRTTKPRHVSVAAQQRALVAAADREAEQEAKTIASWTSPTSSLLSSSSDDIFKALPTLNENAKELKSFLPSRSNEKEK